MRNLATEAMELAVQAVRIREAVATFMDEVTTDDDANDTDVMRRRIVGAFDGAEQAGWELAKHLVKRDALGQSQAIDPLPRDGDAFPMELFKSLLRRYLRECVELDPKDVRRASASGCAAICVGYQSDNGGQNFDVISWSMAEELGISDDDDNDQPADPTSPQNDGKSTADKEGGDDA